MKPRPALAAHSTTAVLATALLTSALWAGACSSRDDLPEGGSTTSTSSTDTTQSPVILALAPNLGLSPGQCFAEVPLAETSTTTRPLDDPDSEQATEPTPPDTLPENTTIPRPPVIAVVDCAGSKLGEVYAAFCLGESEEQARDLTAVACPGESELDYPGDQNIRRAAARVCLQRFEEIFREEYASSRMVAQEFTPTEGVWLQGDHRVVCHAMSSR